MNQKKNVTIDAIEASIQVAPNQDGRVTAVVRNVGNTPNTLNITLQAITSEGLPLPGVEASDRFNNSGWVVALLVGSKMSSSNPTNPESSRLGSNHQMNSKVKCMLSCVFLRREHRPSFVQPRPQRASTESLLER